MNLKDRKDYLLYQVLKLFKYQSEIPYIVDIREIPITYDGYDGVEADGSCLCEDIMALFDIDDLDDIEEEIEKIVKE